MLGFAKREGVSLFKEHLCCAWLYILPCTLMMQLHGVIVDAVMVPSVWLRNKTAWPR